MQESAYLGAVKVKISKKWFSGPGVVITGAFIGPGTVTLCTLAGVKSGVALLWAVLFSTIATIVLQDMVVRLTISSRQSLEQMVLGQFTNRIFKILMALFVFTAIIIGNTAYQSGNLAGTSLGLQLIFKNLDTQWVTTILVAICITIFAAQNGQQIRQILGWLVLAMSITFAGLALLYLPTVGDLIKGMLVPSLQDGQVLLALGLVGTTVVPYNLFLHSILVSSADDGDLQRLRKDGAVSITLGGLISMFIVITGNMARGSEINNAADLARVLAQLSGQKALILFGGGLFAAGFSSALTAPMAAGKVAEGLYRSFRQTGKKTALWIEVAVVLIGGGIAITHTNNLVLIQFAQLINGLLLPVFIVIILWLLNDRNLMKVHRNNLFLNVVGFFVLIVSLLLTYKTIASFFP